MDLKILATLFMAILMALSKGDVSASAWTKGASRARFPELRDYENVAFNETLDDFMAREVLHYVADIGADVSKTKIDYETNFNRCF